MTVCTLAQLNIGRSCRGPPLVIKSSGVYTIKILKIQRCAPPPLLISCDN